PATQHVRVSLGALAQVGQRGSLNWVEHEVDAQALLVHLSQVLGAALVSRVRAAVAVLDLGQAFAIRVASLGQCSLSLLRVIGEAIFLCIVARVTIRDPGQGRDNRALQGVASKALAVEAISKRLANLQVVERRLAHVELKTQRTST